MVSVALKAKQRQKLAASIAFKKLPIKRLNTD